MKRCIAILLSLLLLSACGAEGQASASSSGSEIKSAPSESVPASSTEASSPSSVEAEPSPAEAEPSPEEAEPEVPTPSESPDPEPYEPELPAVEPSVPEGPNLSEDGLILPPQVPHGTALDGLSFSELDKTGIVSLLEPVLERAKFFCRFGCAGDFEDKLGIKTDYSPEAAIQRPYRIWDEMPFYPFLNLSYQTIEELKQDMCTVFTPDIAEDISYLNYVFDGLTDYDGRIYCVGGADGNSKERRWELDKLEIVSAEESKLTISAPVSWGPSVETFIAPLNFEIVDGYIIMDSSYFAMNNS